MKGPAPFLRTVDILEIFLSTEPAKAVAIEYGTSPGLVSMIRTGKRHGSVTEAIRLNAALATLAASPTPSQQQETKQCQTRRHMARHRPQRRSPRP